jgi:hypothetical protein
VKKAGNPFLSLSQHLAIYSSTTHNSKCCFLENNSNDDDDEYDDDEVHRDEKLRTHLQLLKWQRIALLLSCRIKKT